MDESVPKQGTVSWFDLTVEDAGKVRDFYQDVVGWEIHPQSMGDYQDYSMHPPGSDEPAAGICHARGSNADLPPQWLIYITVEDVQAAARKCEALGGELVSGPRPLGGGQVAVIQDPAGAVCALYQPPAKASPE